MDIDTERWDPCALAAQVNEFTGWIVAPAHPFPRAAAAAARGKGRIGVVRFRSF